MNENTVVQVVDDDDLEKVSGGKAIEYETDGFKLPLCKNCNKPVPKGLGDFCSLACKRQYHSDHPDEFGYI